MKTVDVPILSIHSLSSSLAHHYRIMCSCHAHQSEARWRANEEKQITPKKQSVGWSPFSLSPHFGGGRSTLELAGERKKQIIINHLQIDLRLTCSVEKRRTCWPGTLLELQRELISIPRHRRRSNSSRVAFISTSAKEIKFFYSFCVFGPNAVGWKISSAHPNETKHSLSRPHRGDSLFLSHHLQFAVLVVGYDKFVTQAKHIIEPKDGAKPIVGRYWLCVRCRETLECSSKRGIFIVSVNDNIINKVRKTCA